MSAECPSKSRRAVPDCRTRLHTRPELVKRLAASPSVLVSAFYWLPTPSGQHHVPSRIAYYEQLGAAKPQAHQTRAPRHSDGLDEEASA